MCFTKSWRAWSLNLALWDKRLLECDTMGHSGGIPFILKKMVYGVCAGHKIWCWEGRRK